MHETEGDGYLVDGGKRVFADEDLGVGRNATQFRHQEANSFQEEIANVIRAAGLTLNPSTEGISQMIQLNQAIDLKNASAVGAEALARSAADAVLQANINIEKARITALKTSQIDNDSLVDSGAGTGATALNSLASQISYLLASTNGSKISAVPIVKLGGAGIYTDISSKLYWKIYGKTLQLWGSIIGGVSGAPINGVIIPIDATLNAVFAGWSGSSDFSAASIAHLATSAGLGLAKVVQLATNPATIFVADYRESGGSNPLPVGGIKVDFNWIGTFY